MITTDIERLKVTSANKLIERTLIESSVKLALVDQKIILSIIAQLSPNDRDFENYTLTVSQLSEMIKTSPRTLYTDLETICKRLTSSSIKIVTPDNPKGFLFTTWFAAAIYRPSEGLVYFEISPSLKPYLLELQSKFTSYYLNQVINMKSVYSIRMYELLKSFLDPSKKPTAIRNLTIVELREFLGVAENKYLVFSDFRKKILEKSQRELSEKTNIDFSFELQRRGRSSHSITFTIWHSIATLESVKDATIQNEVSPYDITDVTAVQIDQAVIDLINPAILKMMQSAFTHKLSDAQIYLMIDTYGAEPVQEAIFTLMSALSEGRVNTTPIAYFNGILKRQKHEAEQANKTSLTNRSTVEKLTDISWADGINMDIP